MARRVLILSHQYPNKAFPYEGAELSSSLNEFVLLGWEPTVVVVRDLLPNSLYLSMANQWYKSVGVMANAHRLVRNGHHVCYVPFIRLPRGQVYYPQSAQWMRWQLLPYIRHLHRKYKFDVLLGYGLIPEGAMVVQIGQRLGVPAIPYALGSDFHSYPRSSDNDKFVKHLLQNATISLTVSREMEALAYELVPTARVQTLPVTIDMPYFSPPAEPVQLEEGCRHIAFIAVHRKVKNPMLAIRAFIRLAQKRQDVRLHIVGSGYYVPQMKATIAEHGLTHLVHFYHVISQEKLKEIYAGIDLLMLTSYREGSPRTIMEAMSMGKPVVSTHVGGVPDLVSCDEIGYLTPSDDEEAMADAIERALSRQWDATLIRRHAQQFSPQNFVKRLTNVLEEAIELYPLPNA